ANGMLAFAQRIGKGTVQRNGQREFAEFGHEGKDQCRRCAALNLLLPIPYPAWLGTILPMTTATSTATKKSAKTNAGPITLAIDIGGSGLKAMLLDPEGKPASERERLPTPETP